MHHEQTLTEAYRRCRANGGKGGVDGEEFADIETLGRERWLGNLRMDLKAGNGSMILDGDGDLDQRDAPRSNSAWWDAGAYESLPYLQDFSP